MIVWVGRNTYSFKSRESAERFREELRRCGLWSNLQVPSGGAYSYGVFVWERSV